MRGWWKRHAPLVLVGMVPALLLSLGVARFTLNHFFARAPYLLDSGLLSGIAYRSGPLLAPPTIACDYATSFYQVYFSPIVSVFSALSYLVPVGRIEWFAFVQFVVYLPIGIAVYALSSRVDPAGALRRAPITLIAALAFSFSGIVLWMIGYPHYEAATSGLVCLVLVAVVTGRTRLTWILLGLAASVRQDGGLHVALALMPLAFLKWRGADLVPTQRRLLATIGISLGSMVVLMLCQKIFFVPVDRIGPVYFGKPAYAHLSVDLLIARARNLLDLGQVIYYPLLATALIAILRRDARYLLGWAATIPWFVFNFTAFDEAKSRFVAYAAGPFLVAIFWVYLYGALIAPVARRLRPGLLEAVFALICISSMLGYHRAMPGPFRATTRDMAFAQPQNRAAVHGFVDAVGEHQATFGQFYVDNAVGALAQEWLHLGQIWHTGDNPPPDTYAFHIREDHGERGVLPDLLLHGLESCLHVAETGIYVCSRRPLPAATFENVKTEAIPASLLSARFDRRTVSFDPRGITLPPGASVTGGLGALERGTYEWRLGVAGGSLALHVENETETVAEARVGGQEDVVRFSTDGVLPLRFRLSAAASVTITSASLRRVETVPLAPPAATP